MVQKTVGYLTIIAIALGGLTACASTTQEIPAAETAIPTAVPEITPQRESAIIDEVIAPSETEIENTLVIALAHPPTSLDPADHRDRESEIVLRNLFDGLVTRDAGGNVYPELAEEVHWVDELTLLIKLRKGITFHNGEELGTDDVQFTFERIMQENGIDFPTPHTSQRQDLIAPVLSVEAQDDYTVVMHLSQPWPNALQMLIHQPIVSKGYWEEAGGGGFNSQPVGTGPFRFVSAETRLRGIVMERYPDYYGGAAELPPVEEACVERVVFKVISQEMARVQALLAGEVDFLNDISPEFCQQLSNTPGIQVFSVPGTHPLWLEMNVKKAPFDDVRVRRALNYAINKEEIIAEVYQGRGTALAGALSPLNNYADQSLAPYPYNPIKAREMLTEAGWNDEDGDGSLERNGERLVIQLNSIESLRTLAEVIARQLQVIGSDTELHFWDYAQIKPELMKCEHGAFLRGWGDSSFDPIGHIEGKWHSYVNGGTYGNGNFSCFSNPRVDELIELGELTIDAAARKELYNEAQQIIYSEAPAVFLILPYTCSAATERVLNWVPAADGSLNLHDVCLAE